MFPRELVRATRMSAEEIALDLVIDLYAKKKLSSGKARQILGLGVWEFWHLPGARGLPIAYGPDELAEDLSAIESSPGE